MSLGPSCGHRSVLRHAAVALAATMILHSTAVAQSISASFYTSIPFPENPNSSFNAGSPFCTAIVGDDLGLFLNFTSSAVRSALCPTNPDALNPTFSTFSARFTGTFWVAAAGIYDMALSADDGEALSVNGTIVDNEWTAIKGGGPGDVLVPLKAGENSFVLDYNQSFYGGAFVRFQRGDAPVGFVSPEPGSLVLLTSGIAAMGGVGVIKRRRRA